MPSFEESVTIGCPSAKVWSFMSDPAHHPLWDSAQQGSSQVTDDGFTVGAQWVGTSTILGKSIPWKSELTELESNRRTVFRSVDTQPSFTVTTTLLPAGAGTRVTVAVEAAAGLAGIFGRLGDTFAARAYSRNIRSGLENMKELLEEGAQP